MAVRVLIRSNRYFDSVTLMSISEQVREVDGVENAVVAMGTEMNRELLRNVGLLTSEAAGATATDLVIAVSAQTDASAEAAIARAEALMNRRDVAPAAAGAGPAAPRTIAAAMRAEPEATLALISVPGAYAAREARVALRHGLNVMLYSDNVSVEEEVSLKRLAVKHGLLMMGPDCGTAIIDGVGLGFANAVRRGPIGVVAASGTGAQELSVLIDRLGSGVSQLMGTGGRDLSASVGGVMTLEALRRLQADPATKVIVLISKPPAPGVGEAIQQAAEAGAKPVVICFLKGDGALSVDEAAVKAVSLATGQPEERLAAQLGYGGILPKLSPAPGRSFVRGLFSGGTLCDQALMILERELGPVVCNVHPDPSRREGGGHRLLDLGDDGYTVGRPHPMIDPALRRRMIREEANDPRTALILLDVVIGHGAHADPAGALAPEIRAAAGQGVLVVASVTGTEADPQRLSAQVATLRDAGATVLPTARQAALVALETLRGRA